MKEKNVTSKRPLMSETIVEILPFQEKLLDFLLDNSGLYDKLATHPKISDLADVEYKKLIINEDDIEISGTATICFELGYGSESDQKKGDGFTSHRSGILIFNLVLDRDFIVLEDMGCEIELE